MKLHTRKIKFHLYRVTLTSADGVIYHDMYKFSQVGADLAHIMSGNTKIDIINSIKLDFVNGWLARVLEKKGM